MKDATVAILAQFTDPNALNIELREQIERYETICERAGNAVPPYVGILALCSQYPLTGAVVPTLEEQIAEEDAADAVADGGKHDDELDEMFDEPVVEKKVVDPAVADRMAKARAARGKKVETAA